LRGINVAEAGRSIEKQTVTPDKVTKTSDKGLKKHHVQARAWHGHKVHHAKHATPNQVKHGKKISKKSLTSARTQSHAKTVAAVAPVKN
jgi:hypothetical protein